MMLKEHEQVHIKIGDNVVDVDKELKDTILLLNQNGWKTSGCCIGEHEKWDEAWIIIQTTSEDEIIRLERVLNGCCGHLISKRLHWQESDKTLYNDFILVLNEATYETRQIMINKINKKLERAFEIEDKIDYRTNTIESLFNIK